MLAVALSVLGSSALAQSGDLALPAIDTKICDLGAAASKVCTFTLPRATGGVGTVTYSSYFQDEELKAPYVPLFLFDGDTLELTAYAKQTGQTRNGWPVRLTARDSNSNTATSDFYVVFDGQPAVSIDSEVNLTIGKPVDLKYEAIGNGDLTSSETVTGYNAPASNRPATPEFMSVPGLTFGFDNNRASATPHIAYTTISGTPTQAGEYEVTLKLTEADGDETSQTFKIFVNAEPSFGGAKVPNTVFAIGEEVTITLPEVTLGNGKWADHVVTTIENVSNQLPAWLSFIDETDPAAITFRGTPPAGSDANAVTFSVEVKDYRLNDHFGQDFATISVCFSVGNGEQCEASFGDANVETQVYSLNTAITPLVLPEASRATGTVRYRVEGLPAGLVFDDGDRTLSGAPTEYGSFTATYTATDDADTSASLKFAIEVDGAPSFAGSRVANTVFAVGEFGEIALPRAIPGNGTWAEHTPSWSPAPPPSWLTFDGADPAALRLHGTAPDNDVGAATYELTVTDSPITGQISGDSVTLSLCFSVGAGNPCPGVNFNDVVVAPQTYTKGRRIDPLILPEARQGTGALTYSVDGMPGGLSFDPSTRRLTGTPSGASADSLTYTVTYSVTDAAGAEASLTFQITVNVPLSFGGEAPSGFDFTKDTAIATTTLPEALGGVGELSYSASGLPAGLSFDGGSRELSGTPTSAGTFKLDLTATDENGASSSLPISVRVHQPPSFPPGNSQLGFPGSADTLPAASGLGPLTYVLACTTGTPDPCDGSTNLPPGVTFNPETRELSGDFATQGHYFLRLTATDRNGANGERYFDLRVAGIIVQAYDTTGAAISGLTILVPEGEGDSDKAPYYTVKLAVDPGLGESVTINLTYPSGDSDLQFYYSDDSPTPQRRKFVYTGNNLGHEERVTLFAEDDVGGENGRAVIRHTVESDDRTYDGITFNVTLVEVDDDPSIELSLDPASLDETAGATEVEVTGTVKAPAENPSLTSFREDRTVALGRAGGTATSPADYTAAFSENLVFGVGETSKKVKFTVTPVDDDLYEPNETVVVAGTAWPTGSATLTITDDDEPTPSADCGTATVTEGGDGRTMHIICTVTLRDANGNPVAAEEDKTFNYVTVPGTATADEDYQHAAGTVTIRKGQTSASFALAVYDDDEQEPTERFTVEFFASPTFATVPLDIRDDDSPAPRRATEEEDEEEVSGPDDAYRATVAFGATAYAATEGGQAATVTVKLHPAPSEAPSVAIPVAGRGGRGVTPDDWRILVDAAAGDTWNAATGEASVVFAPGETERTFALEAVDDDDFEGNETLTLMFDADRLPEGVTADPEAAEAVVTLVDDDFQAYRGRVLKQVLAAFGRTVGSDAVTLLTGRMEEDAARAGSRASLAGQTLRLDGASLGTEALAEAGPAERGVAVLPDALEPRRAPGTDRRARAITARELLTGSSFRYRLGAAESDGLGLGGAWTLWGEGGTASFAGRPETDFSLDGEAASGWLGVDWRREPAVLGISLSHYRGGVDYETSVADGDVELDLTSVFPYARWSLAEMDLWGVAGFGAGRLELTDSFGGNQSDMTMQMAAAGARRTMRPAGERGISLAAKADGFAVRLASEARGLGTQAVGDDLPAVNARAGRLRVALEAGYLHTLASGAVLRPTVDLGARFDSGDADSGAGVDLAGGVRYESPSGRLILEGRGRVLLAHAASGFQEWAASGLVRLAPEAGGRGLSLSVAPAWGMAGSRVGALWDGDLPGPPSVAGTRVTTEIGYGLPAFRGLGLLTPWAGTELAPGEGRTWRAGMRLELRPGLDLRLQGLHREDRDGGPEQEVDMRLSVHF